MLVFKGRYFNGATGKYERALRSASTLYVEELLRYVRKLLLPPKRRRHRSRCVRVSPVTEHAHFSFGAFNDEMPCVAVHSAMRYNHWCAIQCNAG